MATLTNLARRIGQDMKARSLVGHRHTWGDVDDKPTSFPPATHTHDDRYYTQAEVDQIIAAHPGAGGDDSAQGVALVAHPSIPGLWSLGTVTPDPEPDPEPVVNGEGYVGALAASSPYTALAVQGVDDDGDVVSYDLIATGGGKAMTTRLQGEYVEGTAYIDGYQRVEEITFGDGYLVGPRSNIEWASQVYATPESTSGAQFAPYHGSTSALMWQTSTPTYRTLGGQFVAMPTQGTTMSLSDGLTVTQTVEGKHPQAPTNQVRVTTTHRFHPDGMVEVQGTWKALVDVKVNAVYAPMVPFQRDHITALDHAGGTVTVDNSPPSGTTNQTLPDVDTGVFRSASRPNLRIAWAFTNPDETLRRNATDRKTVGDILFIQRRTDGINKLYHHVWDPGTVVSAGTTYNFGAQWRYMEVA